MPKPLSLSADLLNVSGPASSALDAKNCQKNILWQRSFLLALSRGKGKGAEGREHTTISVPFPNGDLFLVCS